MFRSVMSIFQFKLSLNSQFYVESELDIAISRDVHSVCCRRRFDDGNSVFIHLLCVRSIRNLLTSW